MASEIRNRRLTALTWPWGRLSDSRCQGWRQLRQAVVPANWQCSLETSPNNTEDLNARSPHRRRLYLLQQRQFLPQQLIPHATRQSYAARSRKSAPVNMEISVSSRMA